MAKKRAFDKVLFATVVTLLCLGLAMVFSASAAVARDQGDGFNPFLLKQAVAAAIGMTAMLILMHVDYRLLAKPAVLAAVVGAALVMLIAVLFMPSVNGTQRWIFVGGFSLQPSELAKLALVVFLAYEAAKRERRETDLELIKPVVLVVGLVAVLIMQEPDLGTVILMTGLTAYMLLLAGIRWRWLLGGVAAAIPVLGVAILMAPYRLDRLLDFMDPERDPLGSGFQAMQSLIAVGSGGVVGLGAGNSNQKLHFLPYPHSDFIYAIVAEELGLIGALAVLALFGVLLWRGVRAALHAPDAFGRYLALGFSGLIVLQALINMSVVVALFPTTGIPLPFISFGGTSLLVSLVACGFLLNISEHG